MIKVRFLDLEDCVLNISQLRLSLCSCGQDGKNFRTSDCYLGDLQLLESSCSKVTIIGLTSSLREMSSTVLLQMSSVMRTPVLQGVDRNNLKGESCSQIIWGFFFKKLVHLFIACLLRPLICSQELGICERGTVEAILTNLTLL